MTATMTHTAILFPAGTEISVSGQPIQKPWGSQPTEAFRCKILNPMPVENLIDTLQALWIGLQPVKPISLYFGGVSHMDGRVLDYGSFYFTYSPETGFCEGQNDGNGKHLSPDDLAERVTAHYEADSQ
jgi:hypothetical protein